MDTKGIHFLLVVVLVVLPLLFSCGERLTLKGHEAGIGLLGSYVTFHAHLENPIRDNYMVHWQENYPNTLSMKATLGNETDFRSSLTLRYDRPGKVTLTVLVSYDLSDEIGIPIFSILYSFEFKQNYTGSLLDISEPGAFKEWNWRYDFHELENPFRFFFSVPLNILLTASNLDYTSFQNHTFIITEHNRDLIRADLTLRIVYPFLVNVTFVTTF